MVNITRCFQCSKYPKCKRAKKLEQLLYRHLKWTQKDYEIQVFVINVDHVANAKLADILAGRLS